MEEEKYIDIYEKHLIERQKENKNIKVILDTTEEEVDWLKKRKNNK